MSFTALKNKPQTTVIFETDKCCDVDDIGTLYLPFDEAKRMGICIGKIAANVNSERAYTSIPEAIINSIAKDSTQRNK